MAFFALSVARPLQAWRVAGLRHWLFASEDEKRLALTATLARPVQAAGTPASQSAGGNPASAAPSAMPARSAAPARSAPAAPAPVVPARTEGAGREPVGQGGTVRSAAVPMETAPAVLPVAQWPQPWRALLAKSPPRPLVVWTYPALSEDYGGRSDPARRVFLQRIMGDLAMPVGSNAFWPQSAPPYDQPGAEVDPVFFHSGIVALAPAMVVFFGEIPQSFGIPPLAEFALGLFQGRRIVRVQEVGHLTANLQSPDAGAGGGQIRHQRLVQFLKSSFPVR